MKNSATLLSLALSAALFASPLWAQEQPGTAGGSGSSSGNQGSDPFVSGNESNYGHDQAAGTVAPSTKKNRDTSGSSAGSVNPRGTSESSSTAGGLEGQGTSPGGADSGKTARDTSQSSGSQSGGTYGGQASSSDQSSQGGQQKDMQKAQLKQGLAPHAIMIQSSLKSAKEQLNGLKQELSIAEAKPSTHFIDHFKMFGREINSDLRTARVQQAELQGAAKSFPNIANSPDLKSVSSALGDLSSLASNWQSKSMNSAYWSDKTKVMSDIDALDQRLSTAIDKAQSFSSGQLDLG